MNFGTVKPFGEWAYLPSPFFWRLLRGPEDIQLEVLAHLSPASIINLARTCRRIAHWLKPYFRSNWNIDKLLNRFFSDPRAFRNMQAMTSTLISGSAALQFFDRTRYSGSDLDLYVWYHQARQVCNWLKEEGYIYEPKYEQSPDLDKAVLARQPGLYCFRGVCNILDFKSSDGSRKIQVIASRSCPTEIILHFHSTCVMNVITFEKAYSLYPFATFEERRSLVSVSAGPKQEPALEKYEARGWELVRQLPEEERRDFNRSFSSKSRWMDDRHSWTISLPLEGITVPFLPSRYSAPMFHDPAALTTWRFEFEDYEDSVASVSCEVFESDNFKWKYMVTAETSALLRESFHAGMYASSVIQSRKQGAVETYADGYLSRFVYAHRQGQLIFSSPAFQSRMQSILTKALTQIPYSSPSFVPPTLSGEIKFANTVNSGLDAILADEISEILRSMNL